jgi:hypothetical protein
MSMDYIRFFKPRIIEYVDTLPDTPSSIRDVLKNFLAKHSIQISDPAVLSELDYQIRSELQNRRLKSYLNQSRVS